MILFVGHNINVGHDLPGHQFEYAKPPMPDIILRTL